MEYSVSPDDADAHLTDREDSGSKAPPRGRGREDLDPEAPAPDPVAEQPPQHAEAAPPLVGEQEVELSTEEPSLGGLAQQVKEAGATKRRRPESLVDLYTVPKAATPDLLAGLVKRNAWTTGPEDQEEALRLLDQRDPELARTRTLAQHVATSHDGRFAASFESFLVRAVTPVLDRTPRWPPQDGDDGPALFAAFLDHHAQALGEKEPPRRLFNAMMIAQSILMARYRLDIPDAVPLLSRTLGPPAALRRDRRNPRLVRQRSLGDTRLTVDALRTWLDVLTPWIERAVAAERQSDEAAADVRRLSDVVEDLEQQLADVRGDHAEANAQIAKLRQEIHELSDQRRGATLARQHEGSQLRGSMAGFLQDDVLALLSAVREGLELDRPRVPFALERLEDVEHAIEDKVRWLRSSD